MTYNDIIKEIKIKKLTYNNKYYSLFCINRFEHFEELENLKNKLETLNYIESLVLRHIKNNKKINEDIIESIKKL